MNCQLSFLYRVLESSTVQFHYPFRKRFEALACHCPTSLVPILMFSEISGVSVFLLASVWRHLAKASIGQGESLGDAVGSV